MKKRPSPTVDELKHMAVYELLRYVNKGSRDKEHIYASIDLINHLFNKWKVNRGSGILDIRQDLVDNYGIYIPVKRYRRNNCPEELVL